MGNEEVNQKSLKPTITITIWRTSTHFMPKFRTTLPSKRPLVYATVTGNSNSCCCLGKKIPGMYLPYKLFLPNMSSPAREAL